MKSLMKFAGLFFMFSCTLLVVTDIMNENARESEIEDALSISMRNTLKASHISVMYDMDEQNIRTELIRNLAENINGDGTFTVTIYESSDKGLLDVSVDEAFVHNNKEWDHGTLRRTLLVETYPKEIE